MPDPTPKHPPVKLTKGYVDRVKPGQTDEYHWDAETKGFGLRVNPSGRMNFIVQGRIDPRKPPARITIGAYGVFTVDQAREVAREHLRSMRMGTDPREVKREDEAKAVTLRQVADAFFARPGMLKENTRDEMDRHLTTAFAKWLPRAIASITPADCRKRYEEIATKGLRKTPAPAPYSHAPQLLGHDLEEPEPWAWDGSKRREQVLDHNFRPPRVVRSVGWRCCMMCSKAYFSQDVIRQRMCEACRPSQPPW